MRRNCPHCGQEQIIADEEIVAPWVFTRCHSCENLSIVRKEGATAGASSKSRAPAPEKKPTAILRKAPASRAGREIRPEAVLGAFATASQEHGRPEPYRGQIGATGSRVISKEDEKEWELPTYFSPFAAESEQVVLRNPPATPSFLKKKRTESLPQESALESLANIIRAAEAESPADSSPREGSARPPGGRGSGASRRQKLLGAGVLMIGMGLGLIVLQARRHAAPPIDSGTSLGVSAPAVVKTPPAAKAPVPIVASAPAAPLEAPAPAPAAVAAATPAAAPVPAPTTPGPAEILAAPDVVAASAVRRGPAGFWIVKVTSHQASLRSGPGRQFKVLGAIENGSRWKVRKWDGEWFQVEPENLGPDTLGIGWVRNDLVKPEENGGSP